MAGRRSSELPDLCEPRALFSAMVMTELAVIIALGGASFAHHTAFASIGVVSLFAQLVAFWSAASVCALRRLIASRPLWLGSLASLAVIVGIACGASWALVVLDRVLGLGYSGEQALARLVTINSIIALVLGSVTLRYLYVQARWREDLEARARAQISAMQARIRPHFLFNSLNTIASLIRQQPKVAERTLEDLSELFRGILKDGDRLSTVGEERRLCEQYLSVEAQRLGDRLHVEWSIDDLPTDYPLPPITLQPLLENSVLHGISRRIDGGTIRVVATEETDAWILTIGNPPGDGRKSGGKGAGIALRNVARRLRYFLGDRADLETRASDAEFIVQLRLPKRPKAPPVEHGETS